MQLSAAGAAQPGTAGVHHEKLVAGLVAGECVALQPTLEHPCVRCACINSRQ